MHTNIVTKIINFIAIKRGTFWNCLCLGLASISVLFIRARKSSTKCIHFTGLSIVDVVVMWSNHRSHDVLTRQFNSVGAIYSFSRLERTVCFCSTPWQAS